MTQDKVERLKLRAKANEAKLGQVVPELAGRFIRYPDYLTPPRRRFVSPREQWVEFLACVGPGHYQILPHDIKIGDTRIGALGEGASRSEERRGGKECGTGRW